MEGQLFSDPDSQASTEATTTAQSVGNQPRPQIQQQQQQPAQQPQQQQSINGAQAQPKATVTFSINTMGEFSHEELQQVIRKYDGEYKKMKIQIKGINSQFQIIEETQQLQEKEERAVKAEKLASELKDQALCYEENVERLKEHVQKLMQEAESQKNAELWINKEREDTENEFHGLKVRFEKYKTQTETTHKQVTDELQQKVQELEAKLALKEQLSQAEGNEEAISNIHQQRIADQEIRIQQLQDKISKQDTEMKSLHQQITKLSNYKDLSFKDLQHSINEKQKIKESIDTLLLQHKEEMTRKTEIIGKKEKMNEQLQKKVTELLEEKSELMEKCEELENKLKTTKEKVTVLNSENDKFNNQYSDKVRDKEIMIQKMSEELKHARSTARSQETTIGYFRKKLEELQKDLEKERNEKVQIQGEMRRAEHLSSKASSPRNQSNHISDEDFKATQQMINDQADLADFKKLKLSQVQIDLDKPPRQASHRQGSQKSITQTPPHSSQDSQLMDDLRKLREEYDNLARDYQEVKRVKDKLEEELQSERTSQSSVKSKIQDLEDKVDTQERTINELEKRREMAKKEIKMLNYKLEKMKLSGSVVSQNATNQSINQSLEESKHSIKETNATGKAKTTIGTEESQHTSNGTVNNYTGIDKLKRIKREMELFYKDLLKILFLDQVDKQQAIQLEKTVNNLILSINDQIDEIEIRQHKEFEEIKIKEPQLEIKRQAARAASSDVRTMPAKPSQQFQPQAQQQQQQRTGMMGGLGNFIGQYNPYNQAPKTGVKTTLVGLPPQSPSHKGQPIKGMHRQ